MIVKSKLLVFASFAGVLFRQNLFSLIYLFLLFIGPLLPGPTVATVSTGKLIDQWSRMSSLTRTRYIKNVLFSGHTGRYIRSVLCISLIICLAHIVFQITLLSLGNYGNLFDYCKLAFDYIEMGLHRWLKYFTRKQVIGKEKSSRRLVSIKWIISASSMAFVWLVSTSWSCSSAPLSTSCARKWRRRPRRTNVQISRTKRASLPLLAVPNRPNPSKPHRPEAKPLPEGGSEKHLNF